jgi:hypothetical protein
MPNPKTRTQREAAAETPPGKTGRAARQGGKQGDQTRKWDIIDERAWESFPASDPPATWAGRDIAPQEREAPAEVQHDEPPTRQQSKKSKAKKQELD